MRQTVAGYVWYQDDNGTQRPARGVLVSTDRAVCVTDANGRFRLPVAADDVFVKVTTPRGFRAAGPWYYPLDAAAGDGAVAFRLVPDPARDQEAFSFIQITDLHVGFSGFGGQEPLELDLKAIFTSWNPRPAFVAVTGDLSDHGSVAELAACRKALAQIPAPAFALPGNHDYFETGSAEAYRQVFGPTSYSFDCSEPSICCGAACR